MKALAHIGPPHTRVGGMNTTLRRQQLPIGQFWKLRNLRLLGEAFTRKKGLHRIASGALPAVSISTDDDDPGNYIEIPYEDDSVNITDYNLDTKFTVFVSYSPDSFDEDCMVIAHHTASHPFSIVHNTDGTITATIRDAAAVTTTLTTAANYTTPRYEYQVQLVRDGANAHLYVNGTLAKSSAVLGATQATATSANPIYLASWAARATGSKITYYEVRIHREAITDEEWRVTQYPWTGRFGDPALVLHLVFEDATGTSVTDYSRLNNGSITVNGSWTWNSTTRRQAIAPVTGIHTFENARGRSWLVADIGKNHYRFVLR